PPPAPAMVLTPSSISVADTMGTAASVGPNTVTIMRADTASTPLTGLALGNIVYVGKPGWLTATLSGTEAPAMLTLTPNEAGLTAGNYSATIPVTSGVATNSPQAITYSMTIAAAPPPPPPPPVPGPTITVAAVGNLGACNSELGRESAKLVAQMIPDYVLMLGNSTLPQGGGKVTSLQDYMDCYDPVWGQFKSKTYAVVGDHEVDLDTVPPSFGSGMASGADAYFGPDRVGQPGRNYYSFDLNSWHVIALNVQSPGGYKRPLKIQFHAGSDQLNWLENDLNAHSRAKCTLAFFYQAMWISSKTIDPKWANQKDGYRIQDIRGIWTDLYNKNADLVINGTPHIYERFAPQFYANGYQNPTPSEFAPDSIRGIRQITSGLGGDGPTTFDQPAAIRHALSQYRAGGNGVLKLVLGDGAYSWEFVNTKYSHIDDRGRGTCH
ncbi:MAG: hypothetical protein ABR537_07180, partial [Gemmatimonadales bacterium]